MGILLMTLGFTESKVDSNLYFKIEGKIPVMLQLYVDDLSMTEKAELIKVARRRLVVEFKMKDLDMMHYFVGMEVWQNVDGISLGQDDGLQGHDHTYGIEPEAIECCFTRDG